MRTVLLLVTTLIIAGCVGQTQGPDNEPMSAVTTAEQAVKIANTHENVQVAKQLYPETNVLFDEKTACAHGAMINSVPGGMIVDYICDEPESERDWLVGYGVGKKNLVSVVVEADNGTIAGSATASAAFDKYTATYTSFDIKGLADVLEKAGYQIEITGPYVKAFFSRTVNLKPVKYRLLADNKNDKTFFSITLEEFELQSRLTAPDWRTEVTESHKAFETGMDFVKKTVAANYGLRPSKIEYDNFP